MRVPRIVLRLVALSLAAAPMPLLSANADAASNTVINGTLIVTANNANERITIAFDGTDYIVTTVNGLGTSSVQIPKTEADENIRSGDDTIVTFVADSNSKANVELVLDGTGTPLLFDNEIDIQDSNFSVVEIRGVVGTPQTGTTDERLVIRSPTELVADTTLQTDLVFLHGTVDGAYDLTITARTYIGLFGSVGTMSPLDSLDADTGISMEFATSHIETVGLQRYGGSSLRFRPVAMTLAASQIDLDTDFIACSSAGTPCDATTRTLTLDLHGATPTVIANPFGVDLDPNSNGFKVVKEGPGTLSLAGPNFHAGTTTVAEGTLRVTHADALGATASGTTVDSGATLELAAVALAAEPLTLNGNGVDSGGALLGSGTSSAASAIDIASSTSYIGVASGSTLTLSGAISGSNLTKAGTGHLQLDAANTHASTSVGWGSLGVGHAAALGDTNAATLVDGGATLTIDSGVTLAAGTGRLILGTSGFASPGVLDLPAGGTVNRPIELDNAARIQGGSAPNPVVLTGSFAGLGGSLMLAGVLETPALSGLGSLDVPLGTTVTVEDSITSAGIVDIDGIVFMRTAATPRVYSITASRLIGSGQITTPAGLSGMVELDLFENGTYAGDISTGQSIDVVKRGAGTLTLSGTPLYAGTTDVLAGELRVTGTLTNPSGTVVGTGARLSGNGAIGDVTLQGTLDLRMNGPETLATGGLFTQAGSTYRVAVAGTNASRVDATGTVALVGSPTLSVSMTSAPADGRTVIILENDGVDAVDRTFAGLAEGATVTPTSGSGTFRISYVGGDGNDITLTYVAPPPTPDPPRDDPPRDDRPTAGTTTPRVTATKPRVNAKGQLASRVTVNGPGRITLIATGPAARAKATRYCRTNRTVRTAGTYAVGCRLNAKARATLKRRSLRMTVTTTFTPTTGSPTTTRTTVVVPRTL